MFAVDGEAERTPLAALRGVSVRYPARAEAVLDAISCEVAPGTSVIVFGASGSGKSSILQLLSGVIPHSVNAVVEGEVVVDGIDVAESTVVELSRTVGVVAQDPEAQLCLACVEDEIALGLENRGTPAHEIDGVIDEALDAVGAGALRMRETNTLSGGECQRLGVAAALVAKPRLLLLDEPTSMLDADGVNSVREALARARGGDRATVLVEHRLDEIAGQSGVNGLPERAIVLGHGGRLLAHGATVQLLAEHARALRDGGCWLPLDAELEALTGSAGGITDARNLEFLEGIVAANSPGGLGDGGRGEVLLRTDGLSVGYHGSPLVNGLGLQLRAGEVTTVVGRNGVGKSTLLRTLAGLVRPVSGTVTGERPGMIFQNPEHQFIARTVEAELANGLSRLPGGEREAHIERLLHDYRLTPLRNQNPWRLSGGEKRRLSIAAMLAHGRTVILADEPSYGLDRHDALAAMSALRGAADAGCTVLISSHDVRSIAGISDRILVLDRPKDPVAGEANRALSDTARLADAGVRVPPIIEYFARQAASSTQLRAMVRGFETASCVTTELGARL